MIAPFVQRLEALILLEVHLEVQGTVVRPKHFHIEEREGWEASFYDQEQKKKCSKIILL